MAYCGCILHKKTQPPPPPPLLVSHSFIPPHPRHPFTADPFSRSFRGPIKRLAHSVRSEMCNVRQRERRGREGRRGWDSKKAYNHLTKVGWAGPPIFGGELSLQTVYVGNTPSSITKRREQHGSISHEKVGKGFGSILSTLNPVLNPLIKSKTFQIPYQIFLGSLLGGKWRHHLIRTVQVQYHTWTTEILKCGKDVFSTSFITCLWFIAFSNPVLTNLYFRTLLGAMVQLQKP